MRRFHPSSIRGLFTFNKPRTECVIANNSGIFFTLASVRKHGPHIHPKLTVIAPEFWLDHAHQDYNNLDWGQTPRGLPWFVREEFYKIYPTHKENQYIRWVQFKELRFHVFNELRKLNIPIYTGIPTIKKHAGGYRVVTNEETFNVDEDTFFYNSFRVFNTDHDFIDLPHISHTQIYRSKIKTSPKSAIILGSGRSAIWTAQHFSSTQFLCLGQTSSLPLLSNEPHPENLHVLSLDDFTGDSPKYSIVSSDDKTSDEAVILQNNEPVFIGKFYCALGLKQAAVVTNAVTTENLKIYPGKANSQWIAPEIVPIGSLMEASMRWAISTDNLSWAYDSICFYENFLEELAFKMSERGIQLPDTFFDILREKVLRQTSTLNEEETIKLYRDSFTESHEGLVPPDFIVDLFEKNLRMFEKERIEDYQIKTEQSVEFIELSESGQSNFKK